MGAGPIKFRCFRCNQLLGVSRGKAGATVACPKCAADLIVPSDDAEPITSPQTQDASAQGGDADEGVSLDILNIRPEDIRAEGQFAAPRASRVEPEPLAISTLGEPEEYVTSPAIATRIVADATASIQAPSSSPASFASEPLFQAEPEVESPIPAIRLDGPVARRAISPADPALRSRDLVLPRSVVVSWSFLVLAAVAIAFLAGLLAGHYVWRVREPIGRGASLEPPRASAWPEGGPRLAWSREKAA